MSDMAFGVFRTSVVELQIVRQGRPKTLKVSMCKLFVGLKIRTWQSSLFKPKKNFVHTGLQGYTIFREYYTRLKWHLTSHFARVWSSACGLFCALGTLWTPWDKASFGNPYKVTCLLFTSWWHNILVMLKWWCIRIIRNIFSINCFISASFAQASQDWFSCCSLCELNDSQHQESHT